MVKRVLIRLFLGVFLFGTLSIVLCAIIGNSVSPESKTRAAQKAKEAKVYCQQHGMRTDYCILVDFDVHSGRNRFFIWDFKKESIIYSCICAHGNGKGSTHKTPVFSNQPGSNCTSLGRYKVTKARYMYNIQKKTKVKVPCYELIGLDKTNSNAHSRGILIHPSVSQWPTYPFHRVFRTNGCFGLPLRGYHKVDEYKKMSEKTMLLWAYN